MKTMETILLTNSNKNFSDAPLDLAKYKYIAVIYICVGVVLVLVNGPLLVGLLRHGALRAKKEYILLAGLIFADLLLGLTTASGGIFELTLINRNEENVQVHRIACLWTPFFLIKTFCGPAETCMLLAPSLDRLIAVLKPLKYATLSRTYAIIMVSLCFSVGIIVTLFLTLNLLLDKSENTINAVCLLSKMGKIYLSTNYFVRFALAVLSVFVYIVVWFAYRKYHLNMSATFPTSKDRLRRAQRQLTITVGVCAVSTFSLYLLPTAVMILHLGSDKTVWASACWVLINLNAVVNVFIYSLRHKDIRQGMKLLFQCKEIPTQAQQRLRLESQPYSETATSKAALIIMRTIGSTVLFTRIVPVKFFRRETVSSNA